MEKWCSRTSSVFVLDLDASWQICIPCRAAQKGWMATYGVVFQSVERIRSSSGCVMVDDYAGRGSTEGLDEDLRSSPSPAASKGLQYNGDEACTDDNLWVFRLSGPQLERRAVHLDTTSYLWRVYTEPALLADCLTRTR